MSKTQSTQTKKNTSKKVEEKKTMDAVKSGFDKASSAVKTATTKTKIAVGKAVREADKKIPEAKRLAKAVGYVAFVAPIDVLRVGCSGVIETTAQLATGKNAKKRKEERVTKGLTNLLEKYENTKDENLKNEYLEQIKYFCTKNNIDIKNYIKEEQKVTD